MAQGRNSLDSEPDLIAYDSSSILPASTGYSYGPPAGISPTVGMSRVSLDTLTNRDTAPSSASTSTGANSPGYSNRSRARATSIAGKMSKTSLPLYSEREVSTSNATGDRRHARNSSSDQDEDDTEDSDADHGYDERDLEDDDDDDNTLEMDTLNKNSGGKGGWKMVANSDKYDPSSPTVGSSRASMHASTSRRSLGGDIHHEKHGVHAAAATKTPYSRFERFDRTEWIAMVTSLVCVAVLTVISLHICFT